MASSYIPRLYGFLNQLKVNNNREWFKAHKSEFDDLRALWLADIEILLAHMTRWWPQLGALDARQCAYRIYRDTRFSHDKTPYKEYFAAGFSPFGRKAHEAGFYMQMGPGQFNGEVESGLYGGVWCPESAVLKKLRKAIVDNIEEFEEIVNAPAMVREFPEWCSTTPMLKTVPKGYPKDHPQAHLLRLKEFGRFRPTPEAFYLDPAWPERTAELFHILKPLVDFLAYSINEE